MTIRLGINGFGRIGRSVLRSLMRQAPGRFEVVAINDLAPLETAAHLFEFDSVHGIYPGTVTLGEGTMDLGRGPIRVTAEPRPERLNWQDVDIALECTGHMTDPVRAEAHLRNGAGRVLISGPAKGEAKTVVYGINHDSLTAGDRVVSNGSCTTNCLVPMVHVLDQAFGIRHGMMTTVHCYTNSQNLTDAAHEDLYRARAGALSMVPTSTSASRTLDLVLPHLAGRITSHAIRVPTPDVSCCDLVVTLDKSTTAEAVNDAFRAAAAEGPLRGVLGVTDRKLVSTDFRGNPHSAVFATDQTRIQDGTLLRVLAWYDNEWAFSNRMLDTAGVIASRM
ncbi:type I glyceraldehyde-3-phosphate dehydrogenase [Sulfitobacter sp. PR48]|uniref:type I glyceraldehyde-3-phosphate dehydrogenase n=1 Tax=Sulfitobacter sp. PR48 TaxID=3028383 RepID=UPI00237BD231|nr:type I glyceraldehyde-3-phosphate dehydrogenase [Sulfitobacter sp. PR48]MDD9721437.1 type I glyceraldehyde-3-phosphate dehydrogenase [Sulfitobacter sp. PR48]